MVLKIAEEILSEDHDSSRLQSREDPYPLTQLLERLPQSQIMFRPHLEATRLHQQLSRTTPRHLLEGTSPPRQLFRITSRHHLVDIKVLVIYQINHPSKASSTAHHLISRHLKVTIVPQL
jgi:hypothetical protein